MFCYIKQLILSKLFLPLSSHRELYFESCLSEKTWVEWEMSWKNDTFVQIGVIVILYN